jgi:hypothetical protein
MQYLPVVLGCLVSAWLVARLIGVAIAALSERVVDGTGRQIMGWTWLLLILSALLGQAPYSQDDAAAREAARNKRERLLQLYTSEAAEYTMYRDASRKDKLELRREPVYVWTNPLREDGQDGAVFVWTCRGRAEVIGCIFMSPTAQPRHVYHEFHSLALSVLDVRRSGSHAKTWTPLASGVELKPIAGAPVPVPSAAQRLAQIRTLTRDFTASSRDHKDRHWELRLLPQPLYRYESTDPDVLDGAVFAYVTSAGTDPEALLVIEARKPSGNDVSVWHYAIGRFTDTELWVKYKGEKVFTAPLIPTSAPQQDPKDRYRVWYDRTIAAIR